VNNNHGEGAFMGVSAKEACEQLLWDLICYEMCRGRLSPEMQYLLDLHLGECSTCRHRIRDFKRMLEGSMIERNFG
jgi:hypothetical protein